MIQIQWRMAKWVRDGECDICMDGVGKLRCSYMDVITESSSRPSGIGQENGGNWQCHFQAETHVDPPASPYSASQNSLPRSGAIPYLLPVTLPLADMHDKPDS